MEEEPKILKVIAFMFWGLLVMNLFYCLKFLIVIVVMNNGIMKGSGILFEIYKYFPFFSLIPGVMVLALLLALYATLRLSDGSKNSFWWGVWGLVVLLTGRLVSIFGVKTLDNLGAEYAKSGTIFSILNIISFDNVFLLVTLVLLIFSLKNFRFEKMNLGKGSKILLGLYLLLLVIPVLGFSGLAYFLAFNTDYGYYQATEKVTYRLYRPGYVPKGMVYNTKFFTDKELAGNNNAVQVALGPSLKETGEGVLGKIIILKQVGVADNFGLKNFAETLYKDRVNVKPVVVARAKNREGYVIDRFFSDGKSGIKFLVFVTSDNVLIYLTSPKSSETDMLNIANSLE